MPSRPALHRRRRSAGAALTAATVLLGLAVAVPTALTASPAHATPANCPAVTGTSNSALINVVNVSTATPPVVTQNTRLVTPIAATNSTVANPGGLGPIPQVEKFGTLLGTSSQNWLVGVAAAGVSISSGSTTDTTGGLWVWRRSDTGVWGAAAKVANSVEFKDWATTYKNMITIDSSYNVWTVDTSGRLRLSRLDIVNRTFPTDRLRLISSEYATTNLIVASGSTALWSRTSTGDVYRTQFDAASGRVLSQRSKFGTGWSIYAVILSPGYDVLYGITSTGTLEIWKFDFKGSTSSWALQRIAAPTPTPIKYKYIWMANTYCATPTDVPVAADKALNSTPGYAPAAFQWLSGSEARRVDVFHNTGGGQLFMSSNINGSLSGGWSRVPVSAGNYVNGVAAARVNIAANSAVEVQYVFAQRFDGHIVRFQRTSSLTNTWTVTDLLGKFSGSPSAVRRSDNSAAVVATEGGAVWGSSRPTSSDDFGAWEKLANSAGSAPVLTGDVTAAPLDNGIVAVVGRLASDNSVQLGLWNPATHLTTWQALAPVTIGASTPAVSSFGNRLRVAVRKTDGSIATIKQTTSGAWEPAWATISSQTGSFDGSPAVGYSGYEDVWYFGARAAGLLNTGKETSSGGAAPSFLNPDYGLTFPSPAVNPTVASDPAVFPWVGSTGVAQAAVAVVNDEGYATAVKLGSVTPLARVADGSNAKGKKSAKTKVKKTTKAKRSPKSPQH